MERAPAVLARVLGRYGLDRELPGWQAVERWAEVVGPRVARRTRAVAFRDGTLVVEVDGSSWMHHMRFMERDVLRNLEAVIGAGHVRALRFVVPRGGSRA
ncbi:MAG TPA: DUF721 domain-containing protein [Candidatus Eisenbacteria bacterium]|jgi:predicted nucleic acid-binding Zn ribbon protein|nr:DUF721 domain-containing protein [Candidatus Eisenbacteria bacterium]